jgi:hypothetical protein
LRCRRRRDPFDRRVKYPPYMMNRAGSELYGRYDVDTRRVVPSNTQKEIAFSGQSRGEGSCISRAHALACHVAPRMGTNISIPGYTTRFPRWSMGTRERLRQPRSPRRTVVLLAMTGWMGEGLLSQPELNLKRSGGQDCHKAGGLLSNKCLTLKPVRVC